MDTVALLHYSEHMVPIPNKRTVRYPVPLLCEGGRAWVEVEEYDTSRNVFSGRGGEYFATMVEAFLAAGHGRAAQVGAARSFLFPAPELHEFAMQWMVQAFSRDTSP